MLSMEKGGGMDASITSDEVIYRGDSFQYSFDFMQRNIVVQMNLLHRFFPDQVPFYMGQTSINTSLPEGADNWFVIPRWQMFAKTYPQALQIILDKIKLCHPGFSWVWDGYANIFQTEKTAMSLQAISYQQDSPDFLIVACQLGKKYRSVNPEELLFEDNEFGLDSFSLAVIALTHLIFSLGSYITCPGDRLLLDGRKPLIPSFSFYGVRGQETNHVSPYHGLATGFVL
jgi:hypothetical protein